MSTSNRRLLTLCAPFVLAALAGCTAKTAKEFEGPEQTLSASWASGKPLEIKGVNGEIRLERGNSNVVQVRFKPFAFEGYDEESEAEAAMREHVKVALVEEANRVVAQTWNDGEGNLGAHMVVYVPPEFDNTLRIDNDNGEVEVDYVARANALVVKNDGAGDCIIDGGSSLRSTDVRCGFTTKVVNVTDYVVVQSTGIGDVLVSVTGVTPGTAGGDIRAASGSVDLTMPAAGGYSLQMTATGAVNEGAMPSVCSVNTAAANSKTVSCGAGPNFIVIAGADTTLSENVNVSYR